MRVLWIYFFGVLVGQNSSANINKMLTNIALIELSKAYCQDSIALDNDYLTVIRDGAKCANANTQNYGTRIIVALEAIKFKSNRGLIKINRGQIAVFNVNEYYEKPVGSYFEVALKKDHPQFKLPKEWFEPQKNNVIYENDEFRVFEERLAPADVRDLHSHAQRLVVRLNQVQLTDPRYAPNGKTGVGIQVANTVKFAEPVVHVTKNLSEIPLFNIVIEFKN